VGFEARVATDRINLDPRNASMVQRREDPAVGQPTRCTSVVTVAEQECVGSVDAQLGGCGRSGIATARARCLGVL
jgi:hypothetical protein